jgi:hypothetical protein
MKEKHWEEADGRRKSSSCLGDGLAIAYPPWLALRDEAMVEFRSKCLDSIKASVHSTFDGDINHVFSLL